MSDIFACVENGKASEQIDQARFTIGSDDVVNRTAAARVVIQACADVKKYALESGVTEEELQAMSLEEYIKFVALNNPVPISILSALHESQGDWRKIAGIFDGGTFTGSKALEEELMRFAKEKTQALHLEREFTLQDVLQTMGMLMSLTTGSIGSVNIPSVTPEQKIAQSIVETIKRDDTYKYLIPFFHELFPNDSWSSDMAKNEEVAKNILRSRMSPAQAIRCYFYRKMMDNGNPAGIVMMQGEILNYFTKNDESWFDFDTFRYLHRLANAFVSGSWKESKKLYEQLGINVSDDVLEKAEVAIGQVTTKGALHTVGAVAAGTVSTIGHGLSFVGATAHEHPWLVGSALGTASFGGDALRYVNATPLSTAEALKEIASKQGAGRTLARAMTSRFGVATELSIATAHEQFQIIQTTIEGLRTSQAHTGAHIIGEAFFKELNTCMRKGSEARWLQFEANLQKVIRALGAGSKTGEELEKVATAIKSLLADKKTLNVIEFASYINVRIPFVGGQKTLAYLSRARRATLRGVRGAGRLAARTIPGAARAMRAIPGKGALRKAGRVLGPAAIIGLSAMEIVDYYASLKPELQEKLAAETDPLKRQILAKELFDAQWKTGGDALATGMILSGIGAPIGATFFVAGEVYDITRESIDEGARYMLLDEGDFAGMSPGEILAKIKESSDGYATFGQRFAVGADVESANIAPRFDAYRAYFMLKSQDLASVDAIALTQEEMRLSTEERDARLATLTEDQARRFSVAACEYIQHKTEGRCTIVNATTLKDAEYYAQMVVAEWRRNLATNAPMQFASLSWDQREAKVQEMRTAAADTVVQAIDDTRVRSPDFVEAHLLLSLLDAVDDDLSTLEERILEADVKGFEWTGKADESREYARSAAAAFVSETLKSQAAQLLSKESITREDFIAAQTAISTMLSSLDINRLAEDGETIGKAHDTSSMLLTVDGIAAYIDSAEQPVT
jgi:Fe-S-cluster formation regulator IscX/YfhJ